jgi:FPC/CPF motif-containing protein YcgG
MTLTHTVSDPASAPALAGRGPLAAVREWLHGSAEPFPGARAAVDGPDVAVVETGRLGSPNSSFDIYGTVRHLTARNAEDGGTRSLVAVLEGPLSASERALEDRLWHTLQHLNDFDDGPWDDVVVRSLELAEHAFAIGGATWSVELLHPQAPQAARRSPWPVLVVRPLPTRS